MFNEPNFIPAFPTGDNPDSKLFADPGMSLRDYFAAKALPAFLALAETEIWNQAIGAGSKVDHAAMAAKAAYCAADAMLEVRAK